MAGEGTDTDRQGRIWRGEQLESYIAMDVCEMEWNELVMPVLQLPPHQ